MASLGDLTPATVAAGPEVYDTFTFYGVELRARNRIGLMALVQYAHIAKQGVQAEDIDGLDAMYGLIRQCVIPEDWQAFLTVCDEHSPDADTVFGVVKVVIAAAAARPSLRLSDSPPGSTTPSTSSRDDSSSPASDSPAPADGPIPSPALL